VSRCLTLAVPALILASAGCGDGGGPGSGVVDCDAVAPTTLAPGQLALTDASEVACLRLDPAGGDARYLYLAYSAAGEESREGTSAQYRLVGTTGGPPPATVTRPSPMAATAGESPARRFHDKLRIVGRDLARNRRSSAASRRSGPTALAVPPTLGEERTFHVLRSADVSGSDPGDFVDVEGTARYVGTKVAIFLDNASPTEGGYALADIEAIGSLFDDHLHPIDVAAFGEETDVNADGVVLVLLTDRVTRLAGCGGGQVVVGYFFAVDLFEDMVGSNNAEIFYGLTPAPECDVPREEAVGRLPGVFIHEFQHMINYGQKVIIRDGDAEDAWLDEGLSSFAEELGGRQVPDERCVDQDCLTQFQFDNLANAYHYLFAPEDAYLIGPRQPPLPITQYGADWLFVRWLVDHFAEQQPHGADLTRALVQTTRIGSANVAEAAGTPFDRLVAEWQLANYLDDHPDFGDVSLGTRFEYTSWDLPAVYASFHQDKPDIYSRPYPLQPDVFGQDTYDRVGALRAGSGQHLLVEPGAGFAADLLLTDSDGTEALPPALFPRTAVLRLR
jgi:hypothetical protein